MAGGRSLALWRRRAAAAHRPRPAGSPLPAAPGGFRSGDRRRRDGRGPRHARARLGDPRSLLRPSGERGRQALGAHFRPSRIRRRSACPSPWPRLAIHQHFARRRRGRGDGPALSASRGARRGGGGGRRSGRRGPRSQPCPRLRSGRGTRPPSLRRGAPDHGGLAPRRGPRAAPDGGGLSVAARQHDGGGLCAAARTRSAEPAQSSRRVALLWRFMTGGTVHIVGAGIAGLSAAVRLASMGVRTVIHEATGAAGGRCRSYDDKAIGLTIDNGNHLLLSGNRTALDYLGRIGSRGLLSGPGAAVFDFADLRSGERWRLRPNAGRAPWWLLDRTRRAPGTSRREHLAAIHILRAPANATLAEAIPCAGPLYERLWRPVLLAALNIEPSEGAATLAAAVIRETLAAGGKACRPLVAGRGLSPTFVEPALAYLEARGGRVLYSDGLRAIRFEGGRAARLEFDSGLAPLEPRDAVILAVPPWTARQLMPDLETPDDFRAIVNAHFRIPPPVGQPPILGVVNGLTQWLFAFPDRLSVTISAGDELIDRPRDELAAEIWREVAALTGLPSEVPPSRIVKEKRATFAATPAQNAKRPPSRTKFANLALAGDWIRTGLPGTIEGAARSGYEAASLILQGVPGRKFRDSQARVLEGAGFDQSPHPEAPAKRASKDVPADNGAPFETPRFARLLTARVLEGGLGGDQRLKPHALGGLG